MAHLRDLGFTPSPWLAVHVLGAAVVACVIGCSSHDASPSAGGAGAGAGPAADGGRGGGGGSGGSVDGGAGGVAAEPQPTPDYAAPYLDAERVLEVEIELSNADWDALRAEVRSAEDVFYRSDCQASPFASPFTWKEATVTVDGVTLSSVGVRKKGFLGSLSDEKPSLKIAFDRFVPQDLDGVEDLTLNNAKQDPSHLNQCLGYAIFRAAGVVAPRCNFAEVTVNGTALGLYVNVEPLKKPLLRRHFSGDAGDLYEGTLSDFRDGWYGTFEAKTPQTDPTGAALRAIGDAAGAAPAAVVGRLEAVIDLEAFASMWAVEVLTAHWDGYARNTNNFYVYVDPATGRATFMPWGADQLFGTSDGGDQQRPIDSFTHGVVAHALYATAAGRSLLLERLRGVLDTVWDEDALGAEIDARVSALRPRVPPAERARFDAGVASLRAFVNGRRGMMEASLASAPPEPDALRGSICFEEAGTVSGTFTTTWGTTGAADPFAAGTGSLDAVIGGTPWINLPGFVGAVVGLATDASADREAQLVVPALRTDGMLSLMAFAFDTSEATVGAHALDLVGSQGVLIQADPNVDGSEEIVGIALGGELVFDAVGTTDGAPVSGRFAGTLYRSGLFGF